MFYCEGTNIPIQSGAPLGGGQAGSCSIIYNGDGNPIWNNGGGYGLYMRFDCGNGIETRMAHLQGYNANTKMVVNGRTGNAWNTPPHVHYEIYVNKKAIDPECALGVANPKNKCPNVGASGPPNLCDPRVLSILHADAQQKLGATSSGTAQGIGNSKPAESFPPGIYGDPCTIVYKGVKQCSDPAKQCEKVETPDKPADPENHDMGDEGEYDVDGDTTEGTGLLIVNPDGDPGELGGDLTYGADEDPAKLPPILPSDVVEPTTSCAVDTWVALNNQAALEGRRETAMQRRFIAKADSVIDYGCLPFYLKKTETVVASIFSETDAWTNRPVDIIGKTHTMNKTLGTMSMDSSLLNAIWSAHEEYKKNFAHPLMGGLEGFAATPDGTKCQDMQQVWDAARCQNFPAPDTAFPRFSDLISKDPRQFPSTMACTSTGIDQGMIDAAKNQATKYDKVAPKLDYLSSDKACKDPIATGITIHRFEPAKGTGVAKIKTYEDGVCSNAGCSYDNTGFSGAGTCKKE